MSDFFIVCTLERSLDMTVVTVDYRLAPENPFPTPFDDICDIFSWLQSQIRETTARSPDNPLPAAGVGRVPDVTFSDVLTGDGELAEPAYLGLRVNLIVACNTVKLAICYMKKQVTGGSIVLTAPMASYSAIGRPTSTASKHRLGLVRGLGSWLPPSDI
ncbi:hypothetical protein MPDQ_005009 [Monascus purpureus]|uniref:Alpha/beta hydrolase fold-3 domain-containing protein n=1 Tax=Monascus purpureus TaxID=5098 RepID=A0A507R1V5_MONPU|nr:hypothetical protein MPDQ_005009 [Monascus purpureus]